jgi:hypothetical protein
MLWYKGWLETRLRLWIALAWMGSLLAFDSIRAIAPSALPPLGPRPVVGLALMMGSFVTVMCTWFAGAGIASQGAFQFLKGLHGSTQFTLSLPASRLQLLAVRAALGWMEMAGVIGTFCCGVWLVAPLLTAGATAVEMFAYAVTVITCASALYSLSVLLATFFDDQWRSWATMIACAAMWGLPYLTRVPAYTDIFRAMGEGSPLAAHAMPWPVMGFSLALAAILFFAALRVVRIREF